MYIAAHGQSDNGNIPNELRVYRLSPSTILNNKEETIMAIAKVVNPDKIKCALSFTMTLEAWKQIKKTLNSNADYTELQVINEIRDLVSQLEETYYSEI